jgi:dihydrofolate synthase/folylpolyglutamate synthase
MISVTKEIFKYDNNFQKQYNLKKCLIDKNNIQNNFPVINVVGTNGKGSVSNLLSHGFQSKYQKVGLFVSPAFLYHNERIQINNVPISDEDLMRHIKNVEADIKKYSLTFFEIWTLIAINYFVENKIDFAIIEAGIGGRKDATTVFENQVAVAITSIGLDHNEILGETVDEIIIEKEMIAKENAVIFVSYDSRSHINKIKNDMIYNEVIYGEKGMNIFSYQRNNYGLAKTILNYYGIDEDTIKDVKPPLGRLTVLRRKPFLIIDGCHNEDGVTKMIKSLKTIIPTTNLKIVFATSAQKNADVMIKQLSKLSSQVFLTEFDHPKSWNVPEQFEDKKVDWKEFLDDNKNNNIIVCGSLYFVPQVYEWYMKWVGEWTDI